MDGIYTQKRSPYYWVRYYDKQEKDPKKRAKSANTKIRITDLDLKRIARAKEKGVKPVLQGTPELKKLVESFRMGLAARDMQIKTGVKLIKKSTLTEAYEEFKSVRTVPGSKKELKTKTLQNYTAAVDKFIKAVGDKFIGSYSTKLDYYTLLKAFEDQKLSQNTRSIYTRALHSLWDYFVKEGYVEKNIIEVVDSEEKDPDPIPPEDMATIIKHFRSGSVAHHYWVVYFMLLTGCRPSSAMVQLKEDIDFRRKIITIRNIKAGKRKKKPFYKFPLYDELLSLIQEMGVKEGDTGRLFDMYAVVENNYTWPLSFWDRAMTKLTSETDKEGNKIKKEIARKYILKQLRPTLATFLINILQKDIFTVKKLLDHANIKVTEKHYIYLDLERIRKELGDVSLDSFLTTENYGNGE